MNTSRQENAEKDGNNQEKKIVLSPSQTWEKKSAKYIKVLSKKFIIVFNVLNPKNLGFLLKKNTYVSRFEIFLLILYLLNI